MAVRSFKHHGIFPARAQPALRENEPARAREFRPGLASSRAGPFLAQAMICAVLTGMLVAAASIRWAALAFWLMLGVLLLRSTFMRRTKEVLALLIALAPFVSLLRSFALYNIVIMLFGGGLFLHFFHSPGIRHQILRGCPWLKGMFLYVTLYYLLSLVDTHDYAINLRLFELALSVLALIALGRDPALLGAALLGMIFCACAVGATMLAHLHSNSVTRLGIIVIEGHTLGNPTQLGLPLAFGFLALVLDGGRWLNLHSRPFTRLLMLAPTLPLLALTTSRSAWLVAAGGLLINLIFGRRQHLKMALIVGLGILAFQLVLLSPQGNSLRHGLDRTFGASRSNSNRTSGRSDQWLVAWRAFTQSINSVVLGHGPGLGPDIYARYSTEVEGVKYAIGRRVALHSLFMQIAVETGLLGLAAVCGWLALMGFKLLPETRRSRAVLPLASFMGYLFITISVSGNDINSGAFLGTALLGITRIPKTGESVHHGESGTLAANPGGKFLGSRPAMTARTRRSISAILPLRSGRYR